MRPEPVLVAMLAMLTSQALAGTHVEGRSDYSAPLAATPVIVDGVADDPVWDRAEWRSLEHRWLGPPVDAADFSGRYKIAWSASRLHVLVEIVDDVLIDTHRDPLQQYWDDDCLEIFIDEDYSGGDHQYNHNAFAYHLSLDNRAIDIGTDRQARDYTAHVDSRWRQVGDRIVWEASLLVFDDSYVDDSDENTPVTLSPGKLLGLMLAWCDNDGSEIRENFMGSESVPYGPPDRGWIDAGLFGAVTLIGE